MRDYISTVWVWLLDLLIFHRLTISIRIKIENSKVLYDFTYSRFAIQAYAMIGLAVIHSELEVAASRCLLQNCRFIEISPNVDTPHCLDREDLEGTARTRVKRKRRRGREREREEAVAMSTIYTACENIGRNFWNSVVSLPRATRMPSHSSSPNSQLRSFFHFVLVEARLCFAYAGAHREQTFPVRCDVRADTVLWKFQQLISGFVTWTRVE